MEDSIQKDLSGDGGNYHQMALLTCFCLDLLGAAVEQQGTLPDAVNLIKGVVAKKNILLANPKEREKCFKELSTVFTLVFDEEAQEILDRQKRKLS